MATGAEHLRVYVDEHGHRRIEVDGEPFPFFTAGDLKVEPILVTGGLSGRKTTVGNVVTVPIVVGEITLDGGEDVLKSRLAD